MLWTRTPTFIMVGMIGGWHCRCGHGASRHCLGCGACHVGQNGTLDPFHEWCGCILPVPIWVRMALR